MSTLRTNPSEVPGSPESSESSESYESYEVVPSFEGPA